MSGRLLPTGRGGARPRIGSGVRRDRRRARGACGRAGRDRGDGQRAADRACRRSERPLGGRTARRARGRGVPPAARGRPRRGHGRCAALPRRRRRRPRRHHRGSRADRRRPHRRGGRRRDRAPARARRAHGEGRRRHHREVRRPVALGRRRPRRGQPQAGDGAARGDADPPGRHGPGAGRPAGRRARRADGAGAPGTAARGPRDVGRRAGDRSGPPGPRPHGALRRDPPAAVRGARVRDRRDPAGRRRAHRPRTAGDHHLPPRLHAGGRPAPRSRLEPPRRPPATR